MWWCRKTSNDLDVPVSPMFRYTIIQNFLSARRFALSKKILIPFHRASSDWILNAAKTRGDITAIDTPTGDS